MPGHTLTALLNHHSSKFQYQYVETIQALWSGYGELFRVTQNLKANPENQIDCCVKFIQLEQVPSHPRGWQTDFGHQRKLISYQVESHWYAFLNQEKQLAEQLPVVPRCIEIIDVENGRFIVMQDLKTLGLSAISATNDIDLVKKTIEWLASFHAYFMIDCKANKTGLDVCWFGEKTDDVLVGLELLKTPFKNWPKGIWARGSYWHLATRPEELAAMVQSPLKQNAKQLDATLRQCRFQTLIHGDAKLANFCYSTAPEYQVAAVDFQYIGVGCGMQDLAYFLGSVFDEAQLFHVADPLLDYYLDCITHNLRAEFSPEQIERLATEYRQLFPIAWADFDRFLAGWAAEHPKLNRFSAKQCNIALQLLAQMNG